MGHAKYKHICKDPTSSVQNYWLLWTAAENAASAEEPVPARGRHPCSCSYDAKLSLTTLIVSLLHNHHVLCHYYKLSLLSFGRVQNQSDAQAQAIRLIIACPYILLTPKIRSSVSARRPILGQTHSSVRLLCWGVWRIHLQRRFCWSEAWNDLKAAICPGSQCESVVTVWGDAMLQPHLLWHPTTPPFKMKRLA